MTAVDDYFWKAMSGGGKIVELDRAESMELLAAKKVGRIGFLGEDGPVVLPMNYLLADDHVIVRAAAFGVVARSAMDQKVAFQVDDVRFMTSSPPSIIGSGVAKPQVGPIRAGLDEQVAPASQSGHCSEVIPTHLVQMIKTVAAAHCFQALRTSALPPRQGGSAAPPR